MAKHESVYIFIWDFHTQLFDIVSNKKKAISSGAKNKSPHSSLISLK